MHNQEKRLASVKCGPPKRSCWHFDQFGKYRVGYGFLSPFARTGLRHALLHNNDSRLKPRQREFVSDMVRYQPPAAIRPNRNQAGCARFSPD
jgi:hypothetical protein